MFVLVIIIVAVFVLMILTVAALMFVLSKYDCS